MKKIIVLIGIPGSGKSTYANSFKEKKGYIIFSSDEYRKILLGNEEDQSSNKFIFEKLREDVSTLASNYDGDIIIDSTNISKRNRKCWIDIANKYNFKCVAVYFNVRIDECLRRISNRERKVPSHVLYRMNKNFEYPTYEEGFCEIIKNPKGENNGK